MNAQTNHQTADNGINLEDLLEAQNTLTTGAETRKFTWYTQSEWINGMHIHSTMKRFIGLGKVQRHKIPYSIHSDYPECFACGDNGATPIEIMLTALASCLSANVVSIAQKRNIQLRAITASVEGDMDCRGVPGLSGNGQNSLKDIRVCFEIDSDASRAEVLDVVFESQKHSTIYDIVVNSANIEVTLS